MTKDEIIRMAREAGLEIYLAPNWDLLEQLERFAALIAAHEREECAKFCDELELPNLRGIKVCATAIRLVGDR